MHSTDIWIQVDSSILFLGISISSLENYSGTFNQTQPRWAVSFVELDVSRIAFQYNISSKKHKQNFSNLSEKPAGRNINLYKFLAWSYCQGHKYGQWETCSKLIKLIACSFQPSPPKKSWLNMWVSTRSRGHPVQDRVRQPPDHYHGYVKCVPLMW